MKLVRVGDGKVVAGDLRLAVSYWSRLRGLMGRRSLPADQGLWIEPCSSIHMMCVPFALDVVFLRRERGEVRPGTEGEVLRVCRQVRAWIGMAWCKGARCALELPAGRAAGCELQCGDRLRVEAA